MIRVQRGFVHSERNLRLPGRDTFRRIKSRLTQIIASREGVPNSFYVKDKLTLGTWVV